jgi:hypothetical protein
LVEAARSRRVEVAAGPAGPRRGVFVMGISRYAAPMRQNQGRALASAGRPSRGVRSSWVSIGRSTRREARGGGARPSPLTIPPARRGPPCRSGGGL